MEKVGFIGLGKLGLPCALAISERTGDSVIGYDVNPHVGEYISSKSVPYDAAWGSWRLHILDVRMGHDRKPNNEAVPR